MVIGLKGIILSIVDLTVIITDNFLFDGCDFLPDLTVIIPDSCRFDHHKSDNYRFDYHNN